MDYANLNGVGLSSEAEDSFQTLVNMPVVAKINSEGNKFGSHEVSIDLEGNIKFNTSAYGVHTEVWVAEDEVDIPNEGLKTVKCLFAKSKIWKRFDNIINLISNKFNEPDKYNNGLWSSWELQGNEYHMNEKNEKIYDSFTFLSNCMIDVYPAYGNASKGLDVATEESNFEKDLEVAYVSDINNLNKPNNNINNDINSEDTNNINVSEDINIENQSNKEDDFVANKVVSALSTEDLRQKISEKLNPKGWSSNPFYSIWNVYPEQHQVLCRDWDKSEEELLIFPYTVSDQDEITLGEATETKLSKVLSEKANFNIELKLDDTAKLISEKEIKIFDLETQISQLTEKLSSTEKELIEAGKAVSELTKGKEDFETQISELTVYKEKVLELEKAEQERELAEKKLQLKSFATEDNLIESAELESNEQIVTIFAELTLENFEVCQEKIELIKGRKAIEKFKLSKNNVDSNTDTANKTEVEVSAIDNTNVKTNLNDDEDEVNPTSVMKLFLNNK